MMQHCIGRVETQWSNAQGGQMHSGALYASRRCGEGASKGCSVYRVYWIQELIILSFLGVLQLLPLEWDG